MNRLELGETAFLKGFFGFDAYQHLSRPWLAANVLFGLAFLAGALWIARCYADRLGRLPFVQRLAEELAGHNLNSAARFVATIDDLAGEES